MKQLEFTFFPEPVVHARCDTLVVPIPSDERPLRGDAGWVDWRVCGAISRQMAAGWVEGRRGEAVLLPAPRPLQAGRILLVGLGAVDQLEGRPLQRVFCLMAEKLLALRAQLAVLAPPDAVDLALDAELLIRGCIQALSAARGAARLAIGIAAGGARVRALEAALGRAESEAYARKVEILLSSSWDERPAVPVAFA